MSDSQQAPKELRDVVIHGAVVIGVALALAIAAVWTDGGIRTGLLTASLSVVLIGALTALVRTYLVFRADGRWQIWQGGSWFLLATFLVWLFSAGPVILGVAG